ncbi:hypothetical protein U14_03824 [Candidatus Moduliflexus flocculans]|uniref:Uncharacterized protein n=1 Tax=Candidatus Moduliflexus flocculans TaxID=1499966 RepID=A0A081BQA6_9BACT|nr:hypothetical protein U14_03824 [Candidatus Moduliflexus flocculans]
MMLRRVGQHRLLRRQIRANQMVVAIRHEQIMHGRVKLARMLRPGLFRIGRHDRQRFAFDHYATAPAGRRVQRHVKADFLRDALEGSNMRFSFFAAQAAAMSVFVFKLNADNRPAVFI